MPGLKGLVEYGLNDLHIIKAADSIGHYIDRATDTLAVNIEQTILSKDESWLYKNGGHLLNREELVSEMKAFIFNDIFEDTTTSAYKKM